MDNELQELLTLLSLPAAVLQLNSAFYHHAAHMHRWQDIIYRTATVPMFSCTFSPTLTGTTFINRIVVPEEWQEKNSHRSRSALIDLNEKLCLHAEGTTTMWALVDVFTEVIAHCNNVS